MEPRGIPLQPHPHRRGRQRPDADDGARRQRPARLDPRGGPDRLRRHEPAPRRGAEVPRPVDARPDQRRRGARGALPYPVAHPADQRQRRRTGRIQPDPEPERAQQAGRRQLVQADEIPRRLVGDAPGAEVLGLGSETRRHHRKRHQAHRLRRRARLRRGAGRGLEQGLGRRLVRQRLGLQLHRILSRLRHRAGDGARPGQGRATDRPPRNGRQRLPL
ncbi:hypothetical protein D3C80_1233050 [compost metagenome]